MPDRRKRTSRGLNKTRYELTEVIKKKAEDAWGILPEHSAIVSSMWIGELRMILVNAGKEAVFDTVIKLVRREQRDEPYFHKPPQNPLDNL